jgi:hypothetical protein
LGVTTTDFDAVNKMIYVCFSMNLMVSNYCTNLKIINSVTKSLLISPVLPYEGKIVLWKILGLKINSYKDLKTPVLSTQNLENLLWA